MSATESHRRKHAAAAFRRLRERTMPYQLRGSPGRPLRLGTGATVRENGDGTLTISGQLVEQTEPAFPRRRAWRITVREFVSSESMSLQEFIERAPSFTADDVHTTGPIPEALVDVVRRL